MPKFLTLMGKIAVLCTGVAVAVIAALLLAWRSHSCASMASFNASVQPANVENYLMRRLAFERICNFSDFLSSVFMFFLGLAATIYAWHLLRKPVPNPQP